MAWNAQTADGLFKEVFGRLEDTIPQFAKLQERYKFDGDAELGKEYKFPVRVRRSHGVTFASGDNSMDAFTLNAPRTGQLKEAKVSGSTCIIRETVAYKPAIAAIEKGRKAFASLFGEAVTDSWLSLHMYLEALMLYGQSAGGFGAFDEAGSSAGEITVKLTAASSAPGLLAQMEGAAIDVYAPGYGTKRNAVGPLVIEAIEFILGGADNGKIEVTLSGASADNAAIQAGDILVPLGFVSAGPTHETMAGFDRIVTNTGTLFAVDAAAHPTWRGNTSAVGGALTFGRLTRGTVGVAVRAGLSEGPLDVWCSPLTWNDMNGDVAAIRRSVGNEKGKVEFGAKEITYIGVTGEMVIRPHPIVKCGEAFVGMSDYVVRGGVTETTFERPAGQGQSRYFRELENAAGLEFRGLWDQFVILTKPRSWCKLTGIVNTP